MPLLKGVVLVGRMAETAKGMRSRPLLLPRSCHGRGILTEDGQDPRQGDQEYARRETPEVRVRVERPKDADYEVQISSGPDRLCGRTDKRSREVLQRRLESDKARIGQSTDSLSGNNCPGLKPGACGALGPAGGGSAGVARLILARVRHWDRRGCDGRSTGGGSYGRCGSGSWKCRRIQHATAAL